jgi:enoyl-CoA hydratase/carnithine racemase
MSYDDRYSFAEIERRDNILCCKLHTDGDSLVWSHQVHQELPLLFGDIAADVDVDVVILTGAGDRFIGDMDPASFGDLTDPRVHDRMLRESKKILGRLLDIDALVVGAINGPIQIHAELPLLSDVTIAGENAWFQEAGHFQANGVPGDGMHTFFPLWLGFNRGRYFLLTGQVIDAFEARDLGLVNEVVKPEEVLPRAWTMAEYLDSRPRLSIRYSRMAVTMHMKRALRETQQEGLLLERLARLSAIAERGTAWRSGFGTNVALPREEQSERTEAGR